MPRESWRRLQAGPNPCKVHTTPQAGIDQDSAAGIGSPLNLSNSLAVALILASGSWDRDFFLFLPFEMH